MNADTFPHPSAWSNDQRNQFARKPNISTSTTGNDRLGQADFAAAYLKRLTAPSGILGESNLFLAGMAYPFAEFRLGAHYTRQKERDRARERYLAFLQTFTDPDPQYSWMVTRDRRALEGEQKR